MWLLLDIGNSSAKLALFESGRIVRTTRMVQPENANLDDRFLEWMGEAHIHRAGAVSVVPDSTAMWSRLLEACCGTTVEVFDATSRLPVNLTYRTPITLGNDRIAAASAAWIRYGKPGKSGVLVVDAGTAVTYDAIYPDGTWPGGIIAPGPELLRRAMREGTAQLPEVDLEAPATWAGSSTREAIQSGIMNGFLASVEGTVGHLSAEMGTRPSLVLTGGWSRWLSERMADVHSLEPDLVLAGVADLMELRRS